MTTIPAQHLMVRRHGGVDIRQLKPALLDLYRRINADKFGVPFFRPDRFWERIEIYLTKSGAASSPPEEESPFELVTGHLDGALVGYALGYRLPTDTTWWAGMDDDDPQMRTVVAEDGRRTFALAEIMVLPEHQHHGYAAKLHDCLVIRRPERRVTLLVERGNDPALYAYRSWGYCIVGDVRPCADGPTFVALVKDMA